MNYPEITYPPVKTQDRWELKFGLKSLLAVVTLVALVLACFAVPPLFIIVGVVAHLAIFGFLIASIRYGKDWLRAFAIGGIVPQLIGSIAAVGAAMEGPIEFVMAIVLTFIAMMIVGTSSAFMHGFIARRARKVRPPAFLRKWFVFDES